MAYLFYALIIFLAVLWYNSYRKNKRLPPGPPRLPVIGNMHQLPQENPWRTYQQWSKQYGPIFSLRAGFNTIIILGTHETAHDLLDGRSTIYSSRPRVVMGGECVSKGLRSLFMPYGQQYSTHRRLQGSCLNQRKSQYYTALQDVESKQLLSELLELDNLYNGDFSSRFYRYSASLIYALAYGQRLERGNELEVHEIEQILEAFLNVTQMGTWLVDVFPILNHLPNWLAPWKRYADRLHRFESQVFLKNLRKGLQNSQWNFARQVDSMKESKVMPPLELAYDVGVLYEAGTDTTMMTMEVFVMAAVLYPSVLQKAQTELDNVVGSRRLPGFSDKPELPYINAIVNEVLRWRPITPAGVPHAVSKDDEYAGYYIPAGAIVIGNHWAISLDEAVYGADAAEFNPDRWLENPDLPLVGFGFGRRACSGQHIARNSLFINFARMLWGFDIGYRYGDDGQRLDINPFAMTQGLLSRPMPFAASFTVRSSERRSIIEAAWHDEIKDVDVILAGISEGIRKR